MNSSVKPPVPHPHQKVNNLHTLTLYCIHSRFHPKHFSIFSLDNLIGPIFVFKKNIFKVKFYNSIQCIHLFKSYFKHTLKKDIPKSIIAFKCKKNISCNLNLIQFTISLVKKLNLHDLKNTQYVSLTYIYTKYEPFTYYRV